MQEPVPPSGRQWRSVTWLPGTSLHWIVRSTHISEVNNENLTLLRVPTAAPVDRRRRTQALPRRPRRSGGGGQGRLLARLAPPTPLPRGVLPFAGAGSILVPNRP